jgi:hypothetical protein
VSTCPACQASAPAVAHFCPRCGKKLPVEKKGFGLALGLFIAVPVVVLAAVGVLAAVAVPRLIERDTGLQQPEAAANLAAIHAAVRSFEREKGVRPRTFQEMRFVPLPGRRVYTLVFRQDILDADAGRHLIPASLATDPAILDAEAVAVGNLDTDAALDVWAIDPKGALVHVQDDTTP